jgi:ribonuclease HI/probable phosphoglycerate mutase
MNKNWAINAPNLIPLHEEAMSLAEKFKDIEFVHIDRILNSQADGLANRAIRTASSNNKQ